MRMKVIGLMGVILLLAACSSTPPAPPPGPPGPSGPSGAVGSVVPGSQQDLAQNAGDRVFFEFDRSDITSEAQQILERQASWLQRYPNVSVTIEGHCDERGTREYNLALGERRACGGQECAGRCRHSGFANFDDQLWQGAPDRLGLERGGLGAEPGCDHHRELNLVRWPGLSRPSPPVAL